MDHKWDAPLKQGQRDNPILETAIIDVPDTVLYPSDRALAAMFPKPTHSLKTWGRTPNKFTFDPHWIGIRKQTPLHTDPRYPRYTHQLMLRVDDFVLRGLNKKELPLCRGEYHLMDTHSPHQVFAKSKSAIWYVAVSLDSHLPLKQEVVLPVLIKYASTAAFVIGEA
jgi:hypothetical protein